jgi:transposase
MAQSYSGDLRQRVIGTVEAGASRREAADLFDISISSAIRWMQRWRDEGSSEPKARGGSRSALENYAERILALVAEHPDWTLKEILAAMHKQRIPGSRTALWRFLDRHDLTFKKKPMCSRASSSRRRASAAALDSAARLP